VTSLVVHEVVCPEAAAPEVTPLYFMPGGDDLRPARSHAVDILTRHSFRVSPGSRSSTGAYFNAFPVAYWVRWTTIASLSLIVRFQGRSGRLTIYASDAQGVVSSRHRTVLDSSGDAVAEVVVELGLSGFDDGGWYWFDVEATGHPITIVQATYVAQAAFVTSATATLAITTFNRPTWCTALLDQLAAATGELVHVDEILVVDQGSQPVEDAVGFPAVASRLGDRLRIIRQGNLGGSGGFARGMVETLLTGRSTHVMLLDDDISIEPAGIARALAFASTCAQPMIVGGQMFSSVHRTRLHSLGEVIDLDRFWWTSAPGVEVDQDLAEHSLPSTSWMHRRIDVDYNGWWMCLVPVSAIRAIGLPLPAFIKWDDAEYGLRARVEGIPTVSLPGVAAWHVPWSVKDDAVDWQAYFHQRNRLVAALLNVDRRTSAAVLRHSFAHQVAFILGMQYSTVALRTLAVDDVLTGPAHMHEHLPEALRRVQDVRAPFDDADARASATDFPAPASSTADRAGALSPPPSGLTKMVAAARGLMHQLQSVPREARDRPDLVLPDGQSYWWRLGSLDSAVAPTRDGRSIVWYRRDRAMAGRLLWGSVVAHGRLWRRWASLADAYREGLAGIVAEQAWHESFERAGG
jgi:galactofuranosylgalactofuranosylrhamnosyl-N-acetylglucosaminyl-diphospho-decaprenol beta-1,5/1,6-galactofuranosyltransferase